MLMMISASVGPKCLSTVVAAIPFQGVSRVDKAAFLEGTSAVVEDMRRRGKSWTKFSESAL